MLKFIFLGIVQGLTEFFPVSSSGHLYLLKRLFTIKEDYSSFFILLHIATLFAILVFLFSRLKLLFNKKLFPQICLITIITGVIGLFIRHYLKVFFDNKYLLAVCLIINSGILLSITNKYSKRNLESLGLKDSLIIGLLQSISLFPGISRSGITIAGFLKRGFSPDSAFVLSFLIAIPAILGAFVLEIKELVHTSISFRENFLGFLFAFLSAFVALGIVKKLLIMRKFKNFAYYCIILSLFSLFV
ncbi:MAG: undecaprenyl-diphosphate phosphatase [Candidatus Omnitrophica bacterium]|nr:undecaprenyl-diphosphate phosphatase [Candidatus Omnitrophota bacterium]